MNSLTVNVKILRLNLREKLVEEREEPVAKEIPVNIYVNKTHAATLFASPNYLKELGIGWLLGQGIIKSVDEISEVQVKENNVVVKYMGDVEARIKAAKTLKIIDTSCGSTSEEFGFLIDRISKPMVKSKYKVSAEEILHFIKRLNSLSEVFRVTGGTHSAAIFEDEKLVAFAEDVGRHNAVDKVVGMAALKKADFSRCVLVSSGRQPANMVLKAARVGIPIVASIASPLHSGVEAAKKTGVTLVCFVRGQRMNIYSNPERIEILNSKH
ncbi:formate dehydrogenase accessory sulfurtransferase FdhD [Candidatus Bathyarchaeota archaeon]|nr:MAG: formate dehydrogenase accessory sulfurtransferase FdhD [Candidatus Bathyarchaeota archaeon]